MKIAWTNQKLNRLKELAAAGIKPKDIVQLPEFKDHTRNSIIGMCYRNKFPIAKKPRQKPEAVKSLLEGKPVMFPSAKTTLVESLRVSLLTAKPSQCRYLIGGESSSDGTPYVCGLPIVTGSWCKNHTLICYMPPRSHHVP